MSLSSVRRYIVIVREGGSLTPRKRPGSEPKLDEGARRLLKADLKERPATLPERCRFLIGWPERRLVNPPFPAAQTAGVEPKKGIRVLRP